MNLPETCLICGWPEGPCQRVMNGDKPGIYGCTLTDIPDEINQTDFARKTAETLGDESSEINKNYLTLLKALLDE